MSDIITKATTKLDKELEKFKGGAAAKVVSKEVCATLKQFCSNENFAAAVVGCEKTLSDCCEAVVKGVKTGISDFEAYKKAAKFYFPKSKVSFLIEIKADGSVATADKSEKPQMPKKSETEAMQISLFGED